MDSNPICHPSPAKKWNAHFWITFNFWWLAGLVDGLKPHPPPSPAKKWNAHFGLHSTSDDKPGWLMDSNPIHHPSPAKKMKCSFLYYFELLMISRAGWRTRTPSATPLLPKKWNAHFFIMFNLWWSVELLYGLKPIFHLSPAKKWNGYFWITFNFWWSAGLLDGLEPGPPPIFSLKMKCSYFDYVQLLMIGCAGQWTRTPSTTALQPKYKMLIFGLHSLLMIDWANWWTWTPSATPLLPKKWNADFLITFNFWWSAWLVNGLKAHLPPLSSQ